jgi:hypothetical protein
MVQEVVKKINCQASTPSPVGGKLFSMTKSKLTRPQEFSRDHVVPNCVD